MREIENGDRIMNEDKMLEELRKYSMIRTVTKGALSMFSKDNGGTISFNTSTLSNKEREAIVITIKALELDILPF